MRFTINRQIYCVQKRPGQSAKTAIFTIATDIGDLQNSSVVVLYESGF